jgi:serine/threonine protein kinase
MVNGRQQQNGGVLQTPGRDRLAERGPSKDGTAQRAASDVEGLKGYQLGDCLGKGAFGSVYRALNWGNGQTVAIKQVRLADLPKSELRVIMV